MSDRQVVVVSCSSRQLPTAVVGRHHLELDTGRRGGSKRDGEMRSRGSMRAEQGRRNPIADGTRAAVELAQSQRSATPKQPSWCGPARRLAPNAAAARIPVSLTVRPDHHRPVSYRPTSPSDLLRVLHPGVGRARWGREWSSSHSPPPTTAAWLPPPRSPPQESRSSKPCLSQPHNARMDQALFSGHGYGCHGVRGVPATPLILEGQLSDAKIALDPTL